MTVLRVWDALIAWRNDVLKKDILRKSKIDYLSNMMKLIERELFNLEEPLSEFLRIGPEDKLMVINETIGWPDSTKQFRCKLFRSFYRFSQSKRIKRSKIEIPYDKDRFIVRMAISELFSSNEDKAKSQSLTDLQLKRFFNEIRGVNERDYLICWMMWHLKITIPQILNLSIKNIDFSKPLCIFKINASECRIGELQQDIKELILKQMEGKANLLFHTDKGKRIHPGQIVRSMKTASKLAKLPVIISPKILYAHAMSQYEKSFLAMSNDEKMKWSAKVVGLFESGLAKV